MASMIEQQAPIDGEIATALIAATPESWNKAKLSVLRTVENGYEKLSTVIKGPEGSSEVVSATDEIYDALYKLSDLFRSHGHTFVGLEYEVELTLENKWKYSVEFKY